MFLNIIKTFYMSQIKNVFTIQNSQFNCYTVYTPFKNTFLIISFKRKKHLTKFNKGNQVFISGFLLPHDTIENKQTFSSLSLNHQCLLLFLFFKGFSNLYRLAL